jgi:hypothetical protein
MDEVNKFIEYIFNEEFPIQDIPEYVNYDQFRKFFCDNSLDDLQRTNAKEPITLLIIPFHASSYDPGSGLNGDYLDHEKYPIPAAIKIFYDPEYQPTLEEYELNEKYFGYFIKPDETEEEIDDFITKFNNNQV